MSAEPRATYRLQLWAGCGFAEAAELMPYLAELGVSHLYLPPCFQARAGTAHGYDIVDFQQPSAELGGEQGFAALCAAASRHGLRLLVDMVPNHMALGGRENAWWWDVLEKGRDSPYAGFFDLDWQPVSTDDGLIIPVLADHYGRVLESGEIQLERDGGRFLVRCAEHVFPVGIHTLAEVLDPVVQRCGSELLAFVSHALEEGGEPAAGERRPQQSAVPLELLQRILREDPAAVRAVDEEIARINRDPDRLDKLLGKQAYRLAYWRIAARELAYRRFFDIDQLVALHMEDPRVFAETHRLLRRWLEEGCVHGVRVDHVDGLRDPREYLRQLRAIAPHAWIVVEKILGPDERLPGDWPVDGTTGYDFLQRVDGLFVDPEGEKPLSALYAAFTGETREYRAVLVEKKRAALGELFGSDLKRLTSLVFELCRRDRCHRDYTASEVEAALTELIAQLGVYRTYVHAGGEPASSPQDEEQVRAAVAAAGGSGQDLPADLLEFLAAILLLRRPGPEAVEIAMRFQQLCGPAMAKGAEDTAFYTYNRFLMLNEVGGDPARFGVRPELFHRLCAESLERAPRGVLATSTHDTKRSEDVRARLALLSEMPEAWAAALHRWSAYHERPRRAAPPDREAQYHFYQTLVGAWPLDAERAVAYMEKAAREARVHTSWRRPNEAYETALREFVQGALRDPAFIADLEAFVAPLVKPGRINSLAQTLIKLAAPGVPDLYRGSELWDLSLVDPDNRRPVDFGVRCALLRELRGASLDAILSRWDEGLPKLWLIRQALALRARRAELFGPGASYTPLCACGAQADRVVAFARAGAAIAIAPRLLLGLGAWGDTQIELPAGRWRNALTGEGLHGGVLPLAGLLRAFPVALLEKEVL